MNQYLSSRIRFGGLHVKLGHGLKKKANPIKYTKLEIRQNVNNDFHYIKYQRKKESQFMSEYTVW